MSLSLSQLSANLKEIYYEALKDDKDLNLVPSLFSQQIYSGTSWMGRLWRLIFAFIGFFVGTQHRRAKLISILKKIQFSFENFEKEITPIFDRYQKLIAERSEGYLDNDRALKNIRYQIHNWNKSVRPFIKLLKTKNGEKIRSAFQQAIGISSFPCKNPLYQSDYHPLIAIEEKYGSFFPYAPLAKLAMKKPLTRKDDSEIDDWIHWVESDTSCKQRTLHRALVSLVDIFKNFNSSTVSKPPSLPGLEISLFKKGLNTLLKEDQKHVTWRNSLEAEKDSVLINGAHYKLGKEIISKKTGSNNNRVFLCSDQSVIVIGKNLSTLRIRKKGQKESASAMYPAKWRKVDKNGTAGLQERMIKHISYIQWKSLDDFDPLDLDEIRPFLGYLKYMNQIDKSPHSILPEHIFFNEEGVLTTVKPSYYHDFNYALLENFVFKAAKKNVHIFKYIIEESLHIKHKHARFFEDIVASFEKKDPLDAQTIASLSKHSITTPCTVDSGILLQQKVKDLYRQVKKEIYKKFEVMNKDNFKEVLRKHIQNHYMSSAARTFFYPKSEQMVKEKLVDDMRLKPLNRQNAPFTVPYDL